MPRDYKNVPRSSDRTKKKRRTDKAKKSSRRKTSSKTKTKPTPGWVWLLTGLGIGLLVAGAVYFYDRSDAVENKPAPAKQSKNTAAKQKTIPEEETKSRFDFYTLLPELEVIIPESEIREEQKRMAPKDDVRYLIQVGSFREYSEADSLKARLALLGIEAEIQSVSSNDEAWLRVRVGPFTNTRELNKIRNRLHSNNINTLLIKEKIKG